MQLMRGARGVRDARGRYPRTNRPTSARDGGAPVPAGCRRRLRGSARRTHRPHQAAPPDQQRHHLDMCGAGRDRFIRRDRHLRPGARSLVAHLSLHAQRSRDGSYALALKRNQPALHAAVALPFAEEVVTTQPGAAFNSGGGGWSGPTGPCARTGGSRTNGTGRRTRSSTRAGRGSARAAPTKTRRSCGGSRSACSAKETRSPWQRPDCPLTSYVRFYMMCVTPMRTRTVTRGVRHPR